MHKASFYSVLTSLSKMAASMQTSKSVVPSAQMAVRVGGLHTDIHCSVFNDHLYLIVTQFCKLGTLVEVKSETIIDELDGSTPMLNTKVLFGKDEPLVHVMARHIVASLKASKPVILALSLRDTTRDFVFALLPTIQSCVTKAQGQTSSQPIGGGVLVS